MPHEYYNTFKKNSTNNLDISQSPIFWKLLTIIVNGQKMANVRTYVGLEQKPDLRMKNYNENWDRLRFGHP